MRRVLIVAALALGCWPAWAKGTHGVLFSPTTPIGVASMLPRSPLADVLINGNIRFASKEEAHAHCPTDTVVWVEPWSTLYRLADSREIGAPDSGAYMCLTDASSEGDHP